MPEAVISNTSPLQYLYQLGELELLPRFYQQVTIPPAVVQELVDGHALGVALPVLAQVPWVQVQAPITAQVWQVASSRAPASGKPWRWRWPRPTPCSSWMTGAPGASADSSHCG